MFKRLLAALAVCALCALSIARVVRPPAPVPASAPDTVFSAERALRHVEEIAARPHAVGMPDHDRVRDYIVIQLTLLGFHPQIQQATGIGTRYRQAGRVQNVLAWIPGTDNKRKAVLLMAHYDGTEGGPGAADDGAGAAALLETVRALRARKKPLGHDIIVLFTDGEEDGLLGSAAFVREHAWAKDVAVIVNLEARGTSGRSVMFETGPGNLDVVRALRGAGDVTAGSVFTAVYRAITNDTDLSELAVLGLPALNFAFADGVERYHTSNDDVAHLNPGSLQHHGSQMLALARTFAGEPLPRPKTGDAVFFDLPVVGLVYYPTSLAMPLAVLAIALVAGVAYRERRGVIVGVVMTVVGIAVAVGASQLIAAFVQTLQSHMPWGGAAQWSGIYFCALSLIAVAIALASYALARRWTPNRGLHAGVLVVWLILAVLVSIKVPAASYLFVWPLLLAAIAALTPPGSVVQAIVGWLAAAATIILVIGFVYGAAGVMLGVGGTGAVVLGLLVSLVAFLLLPQLYYVSAEQPIIAAGALGVAAVVMIVIGLFVVRRNADHPVRTALVYAENADSSDAWFGSFGIRDSWTASAVGSTSRGPGWTTRLTPSRSPLDGRRVQRVSLAAPNAVLVRDTLINGARRVVLRVTAPGGTTALFMRASGAKVSTASIDGRIIDTTRYRSRSNDWTMHYWAVPDSGAIVALSIPPGSSIDLELAARRPGLPSIAGVSIPPRPDYVVTSDPGDASYVYKRLRF